MEQARAAYHFEMTGAFHDVRAEELLHGGREEHELQPAVEALMTAP